MRREATGHYEVTSTAGESVQAFVPAPLPPNPPVAMEGVGFPRFGGQVDRRNAMTTRLLIDDQSKPGEAHMLDLLLSALVLLCSAPCCI